MERKTVYIETTIPSYITGKPSRDVLTASRQNTSRYFWENERHNFELFTSQYTEDECLKGNKEAAKRRLDFVKKIPYLIETAEVVNLAEIYFDLLNIPKKARTDSFHIAICVVHKVDYLLSWNFTHIGHDSEIKLHYYNDKNGLFTPRLVTADNLLHIIEEERYGLA